LTALHQKIPRGGRSLTNAAKLTLVHSVFN
jgi:hypothetical protein